MRLLLLLLSPLMLFSDLKLLDSFQANFEQTITNSKNKVIKYKGKVFFSDNVLFKWSYKSPTQKEVCTNGREVLVVDHDLEQVSAYYIAQGLNISQILSKAILHSKNIYIATHNEKKYTIQVDVTSKLQSMAYYDELDNKVQILFLDMKYRNTNLGSNKMVCNYPNDFDMIRE